MRAAHLACDFSEAWARLTPEGCEDFQVSLVELDLHVCRCLFETARVNPAPLSPTLLGHIHDDTRIRILKSSSAAGTGAVEQSAIPIRQGIHHLLSVPELHSDEPTKSHLNRLGVKSLRLSVAISLISLCKSLMEQCPPKPSFENRRRVPPNLHPAPRGAQTLPHRSCPYPWA